MLPTLHRRHTNSQCILPDVLVITVIKEIVLEGRLCRFLNLEKIEFSHTLGGFEVIDTPSILSVIRKVAALVRVLPTVAFRVTENAARRKWNSPRSVSGN
jgi:hypothetical protein